MPSSRPHTIPVVIHLLRQLKPASILDVGVGFGKWGHLFREYTDIVAAERDPPRYERSNWKVRIDGIEGHPAYLTPAHHYLYNQIHIGDALTILPALPRYDLVFMGDIIEHFEKEQGRELLRHAIALADKAVVISTPKDDTGQQDLCANPLERHRSLWSARDFRALGAAVTVVERATLLAVITKPGVAPVTFKSNRKADNAIWLREAKEQIERLIPRDDPFVLVDEEHLRGELPHRNIIPFLEHDRVYWGPPPDDDSAIAEITRLRAAGARHLVFIWSTFWWLDHYSRFAEHLRAAFPCTHEDNRAIIFALTDDQAVCPIIDGSFPRA